MKFHRHRSASTAGLHVTKFGKHSRRNFPHQTVAEKPRRKTTRENPAECPQRLSGNPHRSNAGNTSRPVTQQLFSLFFNTQFMR